MPRLGLDLVEASKVARSETYGEWYRDPWGWPELTPEFAESVELETVGQLESGQTPLRVQATFHSFSFPKSYFGVRPAVVLDAPTRLVYTAAALEMAKALHGGLPEWVCGWRYRDGQMATDEWGEYINRQQTIGQAAYAAQTDLTSFFASVSNERLSSRLLEKVGRSASTEIINQVLTSHDQLAGRSGLPQRSTASSLLAHLAVEGIDDLLVERLDQGVISNVRRWMDDINFEGSESGLYSTLLEIQEHGRQVGLEINTSKTMVLEGPQLAEKLERERQKLIRVPRLDSTLRDEYADLFDTFIEGSELAQAEEQVLSQPMLSSRSEAGLVLRSLRHYSAYERSSEWMRAARYLPHAADHLSRFIVQAREDSFFPPDTVAWFKETQSDDWPHLDWVRAQHSIAVASEEADVESLAIWKSWLEQSDSLQQVAIATQRLTRNSTNSARIAIARRIDRTADPLLLRVLALGLLAAGGSRQIVQSALQRHLSNRLTLEFLSSSGWTLPSVSRDFDPSFSND